MKRLLYKSTLLHVSLYTALSLAACSNGTPSSTDEQPTTRRERNYIKDGSKHYNNAEYTKAEVAYRKAIAENSVSDVARFNLASSLAHQEGEQAKAESDSLFTDLAKNAINHTASQRSFYNLGNRAYRSEDYSNSIEMYKNALRRNPDDDNARQNLRLAQLKLQQQQQNQNQDQQQDKNQEQEKEQEQNQQQQQQQNQEQNQDQQQQNQDKDQQQNSQQRQDQNRSKDDNSDRKQGGISQSNAEQILKAMEKEENATRRRIEAQQKADREHKSTQRTVEKPW